MARRWQSLTKFLRVCIHLGGWSVAGCTSSRSGDGELVQPVSQHSVQAFEHRRPYTSGICNSCLHSLALHPHLMTLRSEVSLSYLNYLSLSGGNVLVFKTDVIIDTVVSLRFVKLYATEMCIPFRIQLTYPTMEPYRILLPLTLPCRTTWQNRKLTTHTVPPVPQRI